MTTIATVLIGDEDGRRDDEVPGWRHRVKGKSQCQLLCGLVNSRSCLFSDPTLNRVSYTCLSRSLAFPICRSPCLKGRQMQPSAARLRTSFAPYVTPKRFSLTKRQTDFVRIFQPKSEKEPEKGGKRGEKRKIGSENWYLGDDDF